jgi:hypothetical protein
MGNYSQLRNITKILDELVNEELQPQVMMVMEMAVVTAA